MDRYVNVMNVFSQPNSCKNSAHRLHSVVALLLRPPAAGHRWPEGAGHAGAADVVFHRETRKRVARIEKEEVKMTVELYSKNSHVAILADGTRIPVSREGYARLKALLEGRARQPEP